MEVDKIKFKNMKILQIISSMGINSGGPTTCTFFLIKGLNKLGVSANVLTFIPADGDSLISNDSFIKTVDKPFEQKFGYSYSLKKYLNNCKEYNLIHANGLWQYPSYAGAKYAFKNKIPFVISVHGMLYPEALKISSVKKKIMFFLFQKSVLKKADILHATCNQEKDFIRALGISTPIAVIPNPIEVVLEKREKKPEIIKRIGFVGRFAPIKNLEILLDAWSQVGKNLQGFELILIGDGDKIYKKSLINKAKDLGIKNIVFTGFLKGEEKDRMIRSLTCLVLPSKSENFGMVVAEALASSVPVIASKGTPWEDLEIYSCGWWVNNGVAPLVKVLKEVISCNDTELVEMGENGYELIVEKYSVEAISKQMKELYNWLLTKKDKPNFVNLK
jgi:glycosyltransferase involved in cell wall biosynthesis